MSDITTGYYGAGCLCGDCLHNKKAHTLHIGSGLYQCAVCTKYCDPIDFNERHNRNGKIVIVDQTNKVRYEIDRSKTKKTEDGNGKAEAVQTAPVELTGR
jgi:hypothetical protein